MESRSILLQGIQGGISCSEGQLGGGMDRQIRVWGEGRNAGFPELPVETMQFSGRFWSFSGHGKGPSDQTIRKLPSFPFTEVSTCVISQVWLTLHDTGISCEGLSPRSFSGKAIPLPSQVSGLPEVHPIP